MSVPIRFRTPRLVAAAASLLVLTSLMVVLPTERAEALPACGAVGGYATYITYDSRDLRVCRKYTPGGPNARTDYAYMVFARIGWDGASIRNVYSATDYSVSNPSFFKNSVAGWYDNQRFAGERIFINGAFFDCTETCPNTAGSSFPLKQSGNLIATGNNTALDDQYAKRVLCINQNTGSINYWPLNSANSTVTNVTNQLAGCTSAVVGFDPLVDVDNGASNALTYAGIRTSEAANDTICFFVGGWQPRSQARQDLLNFGCNPTMQFDSGNSSQMSLQTTNGRLDPVRTYGLPFGLNRSVIHAFALGL